MDRWQRIAIEACKQSRNPWVPPVQIPRTLGDSLAAAGADAAIVFADAGGAPAGEALPGSGKVVLYIGPEGGFTDSEKKLLTDKGASALRLGGNILRVETAALVAAVECLSWSNRG